MDFIKKHYEKVVLGLVLFGLLALVASLPVIINNKRKEIRHVSSTGGRKVQPLPEVDLSAYLTALQRVQSPPDLNFGLPHNLFNPVLWETKEGRRFRHRTGGETGIRAVEVTAIKPLYFGVGYENTTPTGCWMNLTNQASMIAPTKKVAMTTNSPPAKIDNRSRNKVDKQLRRADASPDAEFTLLEVQGPADNPTNLVAQVKRAGKPPMDIGPFHFGLSHPFHQTIGHAANLKYGPENLTWDDERFDDIITVDNEQYKIVAITSSNVVFSAVSNNKHTAINFKPSE